MKRAHLLCAVLVSFGLTAACGPSEPDPDEGGLGVDTTTTTPDTSTRTDPGTTTSQAVQTVTGCVTEQNNQLMLTQVEATPGAPGTQSFQLVGDMAELRAHVGQRVRVMGERTSATAQAGEPGAQAGASSTTPGAAGRDPIGTTGAPGSTLRVSSVTPVEGQCATPGN